MILGTISWSSSAKQRHQSDFMFHKNYYKRLSPLTNQRFIVIRAIITRQMESGHRDSSSRKSLRNSQTPKLSHEVAISFKIGLLVLFLGVCFVWRYFICMQHASQLSESTVFRVRKVENGQKQQFNSSSKYFQKYCKGGMSSTGCDEEEMLMLSQLLHIIASDEQQGGWPMLSSAPASSEQYSMLPAKNTASQSDQLILYQLQVVQNPHLTTSKIKEKSIFGSLKQLLFPNHPYQGITRLFSSQEFWQVDTQYPVVTVSSKAYMSPQYVQLQSGCLQSQQLYLAGLTMTLDNELLVAKLGVYQLVPGLNMIHCQEDNCKQQFSMLLLKVNNMKLRNLRVYGPSHR